MADTTKVSRCPGCNKAYGWCKCTETCKCAWCLEEAEGDAYNPDARIAALESEISACRESHDKFVSKVLKEHGALCEELSACRSQVERYREALEPAFVILEGLRLSIEGELTPSILKKLRWYALSLSLLSLPPLP